MQTPLFWLGCVPVRALLILLAFYIHLFPKLRAVFTVFLVGIGVSFWVLYLNKSRLNAPESTVGFTWWHYYRPLHGILYLISGGLMWWRPDLAWVPLTIDLGLGIYVRLTEYPTMPSVEELKEAALSS